MIHDALLLDLDGVVITGAQAVPHAVPTLRQLHSAGLRVGFITNNASRSPLDIAAHLEQLGLPTDPNAIVTSPDVAVALISAPVGAPVLVIGSPWLASAVRGGGYTVVESAADAPVAVIQGFAPSVGWRELAEASFAVQAGAQWIATNPDLTIPLESGLAPGNGSLVAAVANAAGRGPDAFAGKPEPALFELAAHRLDAKHPLVIGDRLDTDIAGGKRAGMRTALVLTGVTGPTPPYEPAPDLVLTDLRELHAVLAQ